MIEAVSYSRAIAVDIAVTDAEKLVMGPALEKAAPEMAFFLMVELFEKRITEEGLYVIYELNNRNFAYVKVSSDIQR